MVRETGPSQKVGVGTKRGERPAEKLLHMVSSLPPFEQFSMRHDGDKQHHGEANKRKDGENFVKMWQDLIEIFL